MSEEQIDSFDTESKIHELDSMMSELDKMNTEIEESITLFGKIQLEYKKYKQLEKQLAENPPNAEAIKAEMTEIENKAESMFAETQALK